MSSHPHSDDGASRGGEPGPVTEGGKVPHPKEGKGEPKPSASAAQADGATAAGATGGVVGKAEKAEAAQKGALKDQHGRGHRKDD